MYMCERSLTYSSLKLGRLSNASTLMAVSLLWPRFLRKEKKIDINFKKQFRSIYASQQRGENNDYQQHNNIFNNIYCTCHSHCSVVQITILINNNNYLSHLTNSHIPPYQVCLKTLQYISWPLRRAGSILSIPSASLLAHFPNITHSLFICCSQFALQANSVFNSWHLTCTEAYQRDWSGDIALLPTESEGEGGVCVCVYLTHICI